MTAATRRTSALRKLSSGEGSTARPTQRGRLSSVTNMGTQKIWASRSPRQSPGNCWAKICSNPGKSVKARASSCQG